MHMLGKPSYMCVACMCVCVLHLTTNGFHLFPGTLAEVVGTYICNELGYRIRAVGMNMSECCIYMLQFAVVLIRLCGY